MSGLRVVLDTNVVVSALLFERGSLAWIRTAWQAGLMQPVVAEPTVRELMRVLTYPKFRLNALVCRPGDLRTKSLQLLQD